MKKAIILLSAIMSAMTLTVMADEYIDPQTNVVYTYEPGQPTASVKAGCEMEVDMGLIDLCPGSPDAAGDVVILDKFTVGTTEYVVTSIGEQAFWTNNNIKSVSIPESVTDIGEAAFENCDGLTAVQLPEGLIRISRKLFHNCSQLESVVIPSSIRSIDEQAFADCRSLASLTLPADLNYIGRYAFQNTPWYSTQYNEAPDGLFYIGPLLVGYKGNVPTGDLVIKEGTTCIGYQAFNYCTGLTSVTIPESLTHVDYRAFYNCAGLTAVHITDLAAWCKIEFQWDDVSSSSNPLFYAHHLYLNGEEMTDLVIPDGVTSICRYAFDNCTGLTSVIIPEGVTRISSEAFRSCGNLTSVTIPPSMTTIGSMAFMWCENLNAVHISDLAAWCGISFQDVSGVFNYDVHLYLNDEEVKDLVIPEGVVGISKRAFLNCRHLTSVTIPRSVTNIGDNAFYGCSNLTDVYSYGNNVPSLGYDVFKNSLIASATLHVPAGSIEEYKATSPWSGFGNIVALPMKDISRYFSYFVVTPESHHETMNLWYQWKKYVATDGKEYLQYGGYFGEDSIVDAMVLLRQEEAKCFCYDTNTNTEHLLFDFGLQKGDSYYDDLNNTEYEVTDVRDTIVNNESLCLIKLMSQDGRYDIWLEGIGSIYTGIMKDNASYVEVYLLHAGEIRFYPNNQVVKTADANVTQLVWEGKLETPEDLEAYEAWYGAPSDLNAEFVDDTLHVWGRLHASCEILPYAICGITENSIDFQLYSNGEVDCYNNYEIDAQIPGFQRDSYEVQLYNKTVQLECMGSVEPVTYTEGQMATIILPAAPDASKGKYYRLDRYEDGQIIFEQELQPRAHVPYIIVPDEDFSIDLSTLDLAGCYRDTVSVDDVSFIGSYVSEAFDYQEGFYIDIIDTTPDCRFDESCVIGALRAYLLVRWDDPYNQGGTKVPPLDKLEVVLHDIGTGIESIQDSKLKTRNVVFDLSGRKVVNRKLQGIYIEGGLKRAKR